MPASLQSSRATLSAEENEEQDIAGEWKYTFTKLPKYDAKGNVIKLEHNQFVSTNRTAAVELKITLEAFGTEHKEKIVNALNEHGYKPKLVRVMM